MIFSFVSSDLFCICFYKSEQRAVCDDYELLMTVAFYLYTDTRIWRRSGCKPRTKSVDFGIAADLCMMLGMKNRRT